MNYNQDKKNSLFTAILWGKEATIQFHHVHRAEFSIPGVEIVSQGPGIKLIAFPVCGQENKFP
jgi:hypothetical protein